MGKLVGDNVLDAALNYIKTNASKACVCTASADTYTKATSTNKLASVSIDSANFGSPTNGSSGGRKITCLASSSGDLQDISVSSTGTAAEVAIVKSSGSELIFVTTLTSNRSITSADLVNIGSFTVTIGDPT